MSLELLFKPKKIEKRPYLMFFYGLFFSTLAVILSMRIFPRYASIVIVTFTIIPLVPLLVKLIEDDETIYERRKGLFRHHFTFKAYSFLFLGLVLSFSIWFFFLPGALSQGLFGEQIRALYDLEGPLATFSDEVAVDACSPAVYDRLKEFQGKDSLSFLCKSLDIDNDGVHEAIIYMGMDKRPSLVIKGDAVLDYRSYLRGHIIRNNLIINMFIFLTSFIFGAGALFVIVWNASIIGVFIGSAAQKMVTTYSIFGRLSAYFQGLNISMGKIILHGLPEFFGFFVSAIAGGVISVALIKHGFFDKRTKHVVKDGLMLLGISIALIIFAGIIETM